MSVIAYACLATSLVKGIPWTGEVSKKIEADTGRPSTTAAVATVEALRAVGATRVAVATPYRDSVQAYVRPCLHGVSHNEAESATPEDLAAGARVLARVILEMANR